MPTGSLLALLDDVTSILDDVSAMTKVAAQKTAGVLGDDLALNAQQVSGVKAERELPVVFAVARGSLVNKAILVPSALAVSAFVPFLVTPLLMLGGVYLCFEGAEKIAHKLFHGAPQQDKGAEVAANSVEEQAVHDLSAHAEPDGETDHVASEKEKVRGAIRTDFILSAEIVTIALGTVAEEPFLTRLLVLSGIGLVMTVGVYGFVACIVKLDDVGLYLARSPSKLRRGFGLGLVHLAPYLMRVLTVVGTVAMFLVGGGILGHGISPVHALTEHVGEWVALAAPGGIAGTLVTAAETLINAAIGLTSGVLALLLVQGVAKLRGALAH
jgi:predicted DNA repair protein MutK